MALRRKLSPDRDTYRQLAGLTGLGWTASVLGYLATVLGYANNLAARLVVDPYSLLYAAVVLFLVTLGLDRLAGSEPEE